MRILVLDDDAGLRRTVSLLLEDEGHEVATAADGEGGWHKAPDVQPDLYLTDVRWPGLGGRV